MRVFKFAAGLAAGYVLGSRAGREKYDQIVASYQKLSGHPTVVQAQEKAKQALSSGANSAIAAADPTAPDSKPDTTPATDVTTAVVVEPVVVEPVVVDPVAVDPLVDPVADLTTPEPRPEADPVNVARRASRRKPSPANPAVLTDPID